MGKRTAGDKGQSDRATSSGAMRSLRTGFRGLAGRDKGARRNKQRQFLTILLTMFGVALLLYALTTR